MYYSNVKPLPPDFKQNNDFKSRKDEATKIRAKYPDRIPVICQKADRKDNTIPNIDKIKYLVPSDLTVSQFIFVIRKRLSLPPEKAIFIFSNNTIPTPSNLMSSLYEKNKDEDNFLYITYSSENTFG